MATTLRATIVLLPLPGVNAKAKKKLGKKERDKLKAEKSAAAALQAPPAAAQSSMQADNRSVQPSTPAHGAGSNFAGLRSDQNADVLGIDHHAAGLKGKGRLANQSGTPATQPESVHSRQPAAISDSSWAQRQLDAVIHDLSIGSHASPPVTADLHSQAAGFRAAAASRQQSALSRKQAESSSADQFDATHSSNSGTPASSSHMHIFPAHAESHVTPAQPTPWCDDIPQPFAQFKTAAGQKGRGGSGKPPLAPGRAKLPQPIVKGD